jgi:hypothetical protein
MNNTQFATVIVVVGEEPENAGTAALDLAQDEGQRRPVTVVDLIGDAPALRDLSETDDPHGVADCFEYGLSFAAVSHPTTIGPAVTVITSGTGPVPYARALPSARWDRLIEHARDNGELIIFAVLRGTPGLEALMMRADRVIRTRAEPVASRTVDNGGRSRVDTLPFRARPKTRVPSEVESTPSMSRSVATGLTAAAAVILVAVGWWLTARPGGMGRIGAAATTVTTATQQDTTTSTAQLAPSVADPATASPPVASTSGAVNPADSAGAAAFALRVGSYATYAEALRALRVHAAQWRATTIAPVPAGAVPARYLLITGAAHTRGGLDSAVARWTPSPERGGGTVVQTPFALRLMGSLPRDSAARAAAHLIAVGVPVYALTDDSGSVSIYAGAFDTADHAAPLAASLRAIGIATVVAYRTGRMP